MIDQLDVWIPQKPSSRIKIDPSRGARDGSLVFCLDENWREQNRKQETKKQTSKGTSILVLIRFSWNHVIAVVFWDDL